MAYHALHPWGDDWLQTGVIAAASLAPHVSKGRRKPKPEDFIPRRKMAMKPQQSISQMKAVLFGGTRKLQEMQGGGQRQQDCSSGNG